MSCLAGVAAHLSGFITSARDCDRLVVLDGCDLRCALKTFQHVEIEPTVHVTLTGEGFVKSFGSPNEGADVERGCALVHERLEALP